MKKVCIIGHFGFGEELLNGQTIKTKTVTAELEKQLSEEQIFKIDTRGGARALPKVVQQMVKAFHSCENIIIFPAHNGVRVFVPLCTFFNRFYHRKLHYVVIGGWLDGLLAQHKGLAKLLKGFTGIYVETQSMLRALSNRGLANVFVMPNFKNIRILKPDELVYPTEKPYRLCTFSRVMKEKGIEEAVKAVKAVNEKNGCTVFTLDIYGQVDPGQTGWFETLKAGFPEYIRYGGLVPFNETVETLKNYYALMFPTYYDGEGFAGTLLDAMAAGVPVIASDWKYNSEIVKSHKNGLICDVESVDSLVIALEYLLRNHDEFSEMKKWCLEEAKNFSPDRAIQPLITMIER